MNKDYRFFERKAFLIRYEDFLQVMQELLNDSSLEIEKDYPVLSVYSREFDVGYDETEITQRIGAHIGEEIIACCKFDDLEQIYFICNE